MSLLVAVVDDTEGTRFALRRTLERAGYAVVEGKNGADALRIARDQSPSLMILDVHMPDVLGPEVARRLKADPATQAIPILQVSASFTDQSDQAFGLMSGADAYLTEPVENELLLATVQALLRSHQAEAVADRALKSTDEALSIMAHDVRGLLNTMRLRLQAELIKTQARGSDQDNLTAAVGNLDRDIGRVIQVMEGLLEQSRLQAGKLKLNVRDGDLAAVVRKTAERLRGEAAAVGSTIEIEAPARMPGKFDAIRVDQIVSNLISNSVKYGGGKPILLTLSAAGSAAVLTIVDRGSGIVRDDRSKVFERYDRGDAAPQTGSYGLGLWIVRKLVELHGGTIELDGQAAVGTTFKIVLPI